MIYRKKPRKFVMPEITLIPLIDTALTLLVIFMLTAPMVQHGIKVDLPQGNSKEVGQQQELVVSMNKDGKIYFNSYPIEKENLTTAIKKSMAGRTDLPVYVRADESLSYGKVIELVDELKQTGIQYVAMSTRAFTNS